MLTTTYYGNFFGNDFTLLSKTLERLFPEASRGNVHETATEYKIQIAIPGFTKEQVNVESEKNSLIVSAQLPEKEGADNVPVKVHQQEFLVGPFKRKFQIPTNFDINRADAQLENGILTITIPTSDEVIKKVFEVR